jgi:hypothetical protein
MTKLKWFGLLTCGAFLLAAPAAARMSSTSTTTTKFVNFSLAQTVGTKCPGSSKCSNIAAEPAIRSDLAGNFYAASENGVTSGTEAWKSVDGGRHYTTLTSPDSTSGTDETGFAPGGGDVDLATATAKNQAGNYNVYVASLYLANIAVSTSTDAGKTWTLNPLGADISGADDREWIAADGASKVCVSYHDAEQNIEVNCSTDAGQTFTQVTSAIDAGHIFQAGENAIGNLAIDPKTHDIYQVYSAITTADETACAPQLGVSEGTCDYHGVYMAVSTDGGQSFTDYPVYINKNATVGYGHQFTNVSVDRAGNVYSVYSDDHWVWYSFSTDHGKTWHGTYRVSAVDGTHIMPWSTAGAAGKLDIVYYQSPSYVANTTPDNYPDTVNWYVVMAQNLHALKPGTSASFNKYRATPIVHHGAVCESGAGCTGNRDLYDDFGVAANPLTGWASIVYSDDQYSKDKLSNPSCTVETTNTGSCDHTAISTQISGGRIY